METRRELGRLFGFNKRFCTDIDSGIWDVAYVKDLLTETVVNKQFNCSKFGPHTSDKLGWVRLLLSVIIICEYN